MEKTSGMRWRGVPIEELSLDELDDAFDLSEKAVNDTLASPRRPVGLVHYMQCVIDINAEIRSRMARA